MGFNYQFKQNTIEKKIWTLFSYQYHKKTHGKTCNKHGFLKKRIHTLHKEKKLTSPPLRNYTTPEKQNKYRVQHGVCLSQAYELFQN